MPKARTKSKRKIGVKQGRKAHPWRSCPLGKYWVSAHPRHRTSSRGLAYVQSVRGHCRSGRSHKDHLYRDEIHEISSKHFAKFKGLALPRISRFLKKQDTKYDDLIQGWTQYWNDVLKPADPLTPYVVKALIATESSFIPTKWNGRRGKHSVHGLMQVTVESVQLLKNPKELRDHFINLASEDMKDPNLAICAGVRWLFRKKEIAESRLKKKISWREAIVEFKGYRTVQERRGMDKFDNDYSDMMRSPLK